MFSGSAGGTALQTSTAPAVGLVLKALLSPVQAQALVNWVYVDFWLAVALPWCFALALWPVWRGLMHGVLQLLT
jgi:hypothetical protein